MKTIFNDLRSFYNECKNQDFAFYMASAYLVFTYLRPQAIYPTINILPWTQLSIVAGLAYLAAKGRLKFQFVHFILLVFGIIVLVSSYLSEYQEISLEKLDIIFIWLIEVIFFTSCITTIKQYRLITVLFFLILFKMSFFGAKTWVQRGFGFKGWGIAGPDGFFANSGEFSLLMAMLAVMSLAFLLSHKNVKYIYYLLPITAIMTVMGASSRGGQLALFLSLLLFGVIIGKLKIKNILLMSLIAVVTVNIIPDEQKARFFSAGEDKTSVTRLAYWDAGLEMMNEHKYFGVGFYAFPQYFHDNYSGSLPPDIYNPFNKEAAHNSFIEVGSTLGYSGLICYLWLIYYIHRLNKKTRQALTMEKPLSNNSWVIKYSIGLDATLAAFLVGSFFMSVAFYPYLYLLIMLSQSLNTCISKEINVYKKNTPVSL